MPAHDTRVALSIRALSKTYRVGVRGCVTAARALDRVDLEASAGELIVVSGEDGAGKSTLLLCAAGLLRPDAGRVAWFGVRAEPRRWPLGVRYVSARNGFYPFLTARESLGFAPPPHRLRSRERACKERELVERLGLAPVADQRIGTLNDEQRWRLSLAHALLGEPRLLIADRSPQLDGDADAMPTLGEMLGSLRDEGLAIVLGTGHGARLTPYANATLELHHGRVRTRLARVAECAAIR